MLNKMTYNDIVDEKGIFSYIDDVTPLPFKDVVTPVEMDAAFEFKYGDMNVTQTVITMVIKYGEEETLKRCAGVFLTVFRAKWDRLYDSFISDLPLSVSERETLKEDNTLNGSVNHNVSAYDSNDLVADNQDKTDNSTNHNYTKDTVSYNALLRNVEALEDHYIYAIMFNDIKDSLFMLIQ